MTVYEENEKKKEWLSKYKTLLKKQENLLFKIQEIRASKMFPSYQMDGMPRASSSSDLSQFAATVDELMEELKYTVDMVDSAKRKIESQIKKMNSERHAEVLKLRYIKMMDWDSIASEIGISYRHVLRIHGEALEMLEIS